MRLEQMDVDTVREAISNGKLNHLFEYTNQWGMHSSRTLLYHAVAIDAVDVVDLLLETSGIDVNKGTDYLGYTPLHRAGDPSMVNKLISAGGDCNITASDGNYPCMTCCAIPGFCVQTFYCLYFFSSIPINYQNIHGHTALRLAWHNTEVANLLISLGYHGDIQDNIGLSYDNIRQTPPEISS